MFVREITARNVRRCSADARKADSRGEVAQEVGPFEIGWKARKHSWVQKTNMLFVDNPVGTGFSYVEEGYNFTRNNTEIADDLMARFIPPHPTMPPWPSPTSPSHSVTRMALHSSPSLSIPPPFHCTYVPPPVQYKLP